MTYREKLKVFNPEYSDDVIDYILKEDCPGYHFLSARDPEYCNPYSPACVSCWDRECPDPEPDKPMRIGDHEFSVKDDGTTSVRRVPANEQPYVTVTFPRAAKDDNGTPPTENINAPVILDSGDRTEFASGAVRDMREGKGRCDLMPLEIVRDYLNDDVIGYITNFMQDGDTSELYEALHVFGARAFSDDYTMFLEVAKHFEEGAKKYGEGNFKKGLPVWCYIDSAIRHYFKWCRGDTNEPHDRAFCWNLMCCIWEVDHHEYRKGDTDS